MPTKAQASKTRQTINKAENQLLRLQTALIQEGQYAGLVRERMEKAKKLLGEAWSEVLHVC